MQSLGYPGPSWWGRIAADESTHSPGLRHKDRDALPRHRNLSCWHLMSIPGSLGSLSPSWRHFEVLFIPAQCSCLEEIRWLTLWAQLLFPPLLKGSEDGQSSFCTTVSKAQWEGSCPRQQGFSKLVRCKAPERGCFESSQESPLTDEGLSWALNTDVWGRHHTVTTKQPCWDVGFEGRHLHQPEAGWF